ncbi:MULTISPECIES: HlyD family secretion protein [unclassified Aureimonas]|uniref:HlyD family secretion protein n=1 Tax=unclassified Aureimonas TaxID=2615206 RepID=UPI0006F904E1|nr:MULTISPECIES: efflux RND transporter periplasmic adaptor subunit [unclassified Aureimonas]KQT68977.1 hypothetical protein ASG54_04785 [Aureimonas sp. Leaf460]KQT69207.1 hypothetical protein ASG62_17390 [Aureimonas sp. Leaf427]
MKYRIGLVAVAALALGALAWPDAEKRGPETAEVSAASLAPLSSSGEAAPEGARVVTGLGIVEPAGGEIDLAFPMLGTIARITALEGDRVARGTVLAELANDDLKARLAQTKATLDIRTAEFEMASKGPRPQEIARAESELAGEEASLHLLELQAARRGKLVGKGSVTQEAADTADSAVKAGRHRRDSAAEALSMLREGERGETVAAAKATMALALHQVEEAEATLAKSYLKAPTDGTILRLYREVGEAVSTQPAVPIVQIADLTHLVVRAQIDESDIAALRVGQSARISAPALGGHDLKGRVTRISPRLGAKTVSDGSPTEKRDARVLDVIVALDPGVTLPVSLRVDAFIDVSDPSVAGTEPGLIDLAAELRR